MVKLILNGREIETEEGLNVLQVALEHGVYIPHLCFHPALSAPAGCRLCLTEIEVGGRRTLTTACDARVVDGMVVDTDTPEVEQARAAVLEFLLINHPLDCPVCDRSGECELQDYSYTYGRDFSRFEEEKVVHPREDIGEHVLLYADRCVCCTRCIRFGDEVSGTSELGLLHRGVHSQVGIFPEKRLDNRMSGNVVDICPVGALVDKDFLFAQPVWKLRGVDTICPGCSAGCNVRADVSAEQVYRLKPRVNLEVNHYWMCDEGRYGWHYVHSPSRLPFPFLRQQDRQVPASWEQAIAAAHQGLEQIHQSYGGQAIATLFSNSMTNEANYLLGRLAGEVWQTPQVSRRDRVAPEGDVSFASGFKIRADKTPNARGVSDLAAGLGLKLLEPEALWQGMEEGRIRAAVVLGGHPRERLSPREKQVLGRLDWLVVQDLLHSELTELAHVVLPSSSFAEEDGTFTNVDGRVQRIRQAIRPGGAARPGWQGLQKLARAAGCTWDYDHPGDIMVEIGRRLKGVYADLTYEILQAREPDQRGGGAAYGGGWATWLQQQGFLHIEDHTRSR